MQVVLVSTWGTECGIATYSEQFAYGLLSHDVGVAILAPQEPGSGVRDKKRVIPYELCWQRDDRGQSNEVVIPAAAKKFGADIVHFQHEGGLFRSNPGFIRVLQACRKAGLLTVVTLHTVFPYGGADSRSGLFDKILSNADVVIVHTPEGAASLSCAHGDAFVYTIPHGTPTPSKGDPVKGAELLGLPRQVIEDCRVGLVFGFVGPNKNILHTIKSFATAKAARLIPHDRMLIIRGQCTDPSYGQAVDAAICASGYEDTIRFSPAYTSDKDVPHVMSLASWGVLNSTSLTYSASGQVHLYASYGVPFAVAARPIYRDAIEAGMPAFWLAEDPGQVTQASVSTIAGVARDFPLQNKLRARLKQFHHRTSWEKLSAVTAEVYKRLLG